MKTRDERCQHMETAMTHRLALQRCINFLPQAVQGLQVLFGGFLKPLKHLVHAFALGGDGWRAGIRRRLRGCDVRGRA